MESRNDMVMGWGGIAKVIGVDPRTAQRYEETLELPVHRRPGPGSKPRVYAFRAELDAWLGGAAGGSARPPAEVVGTPISALDRILAIARDTTLYRSRYALRVKLQRSARGLRANFTCEFELHNATREPQPYVQQVTIDDRDDGRFLRMVMSANDSVMYDLEQPASKEKFIGYTLYSGPNALLHPTTSGIVYRCRSSWSEYHPENDIWYNHLILPTLGVELETSAPPEFNVTPSFSSSELFLKGEHIDVAWNRRT